MSPGSKKSNQNVDINCDLFDLKSIIWVQLSR